MVHRLGNIYVTGVGVQNLFLLSHGMIRSVWNGLIGLPFQERERQSQLSRDWLEQVPNG